jgi:hypothetical protein
MTNRSWHWDQPTIRTWVYVACAAFFVVAVLPRIPRVSLRAWQALATAAALVAVAWALTGEITSARGSNASADQLVANLPKPLDWVDVASQRQSVTFFGENIGDANGVWLLEFWNKSIVHDWTLDASAPRPDPTITPDVKTTDGRMYPDPGTDYAVTSGGSKCRSDRRFAAEGLVLRRITPSVAAAGGAVRAHRRRLDQRAMRSTRSARPGAARRTVTVSASRLGFCADGAEGARDDQGSGAVALNEQRPSRCSAARS